MAYSEYTPSTVISRALFNFDAFGAWDYILTGTIRVSVSDSFSSADYLAHGFDSDLYTSGSNEIDWSAQAEANVQEVLGIYSNFANITFQWVGDFDTDSVGSDMTPNPLDLGLASASEINISWIYRTDVDFAGISGGPSDTWLGYVGGAGDVFLNRASYSDTTLNVNTSARDTLMHELGHSMGLAHPHHTYNSATGAATITADYAATQYIGFHQLGFQISSATDMNKEYFSIMSYDDQQSHTHTPMILDVIALQQAYGEGQGTTSIGNDTILAGTSGYRTYFDKGGVDTIDLSLYSTGAYLHMGATIAGADHLVGVSMSTSDAQVMMVQGGDPANLRWYYGEYENAVGSSVADSLVGNSLANVISGGDGADTLNGAAGSDTLYAGSGLWTDVLIGGVGDDIYELYNVASQVNENAGEGWDTVRSYAWSTTLWDNVEDLQLVDPSNNTDGIGNSLGNILRGNLGRNHLNGMDGNDILIGNAGDDTLDGGNGSDTLNGGDANDTLLAGSGLWTDVLVGAAGDDTYELYNVASQIYENAGEGRDTVRSYAWSTTLWDNVEDLQLVDPSSNTDGIGNALGNVITGNAGNNFLNGLAGSDILIGNAGNDILHAGSGLWTDVLMGGAGDDIYELYNVGSQVLENVGEGTDTLRSYAWVTTLPANVENLLLVDTVSNVNGTGNALNNSIAGNAGNNVLSGLGGADTLAGGAGQDTFVLRPGDGGSSLSLADLITDYQDGTDSIGLGGGLAYAGLTIAQGTGAHASDTLIQRTATGEYLAILQNVNSSVLDILDFKSISD
jgi:Ca2+-binding RTX toxin-like protein